MHLDQLPGSFYGPVNLVDLLRRRTLHQAHDLAFIYLQDGEKEEVRVTYEELDRQARAIGAMLQAKGLSGHQALLLYPAGLDFIAAFFGCMYAGVVAVTAYPPRRNRNMHRIEAIANDAHAEIALSTRESIDRVREFIKETPDLTRLEWCATDEIDLRAAENWQDPEVHGENLALLQYTSGSTGIPKGVMISHANLMHNSAMINYAFEPTRNGYGVFWLPSYHDMGLVGGILQPMYCGRPNYLFSPAAFLQKPLRWLQAISRYRATVSGGPNFAYDLAVEKITDEEAAALDLSSWTLAFNGAEPVRADTLERFVKKFGRCGFKLEAFYPCYGLAEATLLVSGGLKAAPPVIRSVDADALENHEVVEALRDEDGSRELVGSGGNLLDQQIVIVDPETFTPCPANRVGEVWVAGPSIAQGYWNRPEDSAATFKAYLRDSGEGPFMRTGDLGFLLNNELFITGRLKDLIIIRGVNYYPQDIEYTIDRCHENLRRNSGAAFTIGEMGRERLVIVQEAERRRDLDYDDIIQAIRRAVSNEHELPIDAVVLLKAGSIPKTSSGKIQRHACREGYLEKSLDAVAQWEIGQAASVKTPRRRASDKQAPVAPASPTLIAVMDEVRKVAKERAGELSADSNIVELGLDSLERMEIVASLEERFGGRLPEEVLPDIETCGQVAAAIERYIGVTPREKSAGATGSEISSERYRFADFPEIRQLKMGMQAVAAAGLTNPFFREHQSVIADTTVVGGRELVNYSCFNYLGMSGDPAVHEAAKRAIDRYGTSVSASRLVSGEKTIHRELEAAISAMMGTDDAITFCAGHGTNESTIGHLFGPGDLVLHDALAHNSIIQGAILSGARRRPFRHNDWQHCDELLAQQRHEYRRVLIAIEGVYSMDGDFPDLPKFVEVRNKHKAMLFIDEAHSIGVMGQRGRGLREYYNLAATDCDLWMGTLSKSLGSVGGYITGGREVIEYLKYTAPAFVFATGPAPSSAAAALAAIEIMDREPERVARLAHNAAYFLRLARERGLNTGTSSGTPVVPIILGNSQHCLAASQMMFERGINVQPILHPAVEESASRLRFFINARHTEAQLLSTIDKLVEVLAAIDPTHLRAAMATNGSAVHTAAIAPVT